MGVYGQFLEQGKLYEYVENRYYEVTDDREDDVSLSPFVSGICILSLTEGTDAAQKLTVGDIIVSINGKTVMGMDTVAEEIGRLRVGDTVTVTCMRGKIGTAYRVVLSEAP